MFVPLYDDVEKKRPPIMTSVLLALNLFVFIYQFRLSLDDPTWQSYMDFILKWGLKPTHLANGKYLTMYTCMFLHADFMHFAGNMVVLWAFAWTLEEYLGPVRFGVLYLACGLAAGGAWCATNWGSDIPCVGASGAIAGVMGAYVFQFGFSTKLRCMMFLFARLIFFHISTMWFAVIWIGMQILGVMMESPDQPGGVAWWAHLGGFVAGLVMLPILNANSAQLTEDRDGSLSIANLKEEEARIEAEQKALEEAAAMPIHCQGCESELEESHLIAPTLYRCPGCGQLNMDPKSLPPAKKPATSGRA
ncbi:MAG: rhomboid family intramembrane serine protease [Planctomycetaceae bacterium]|nr:rhomboid family intramembrane serine protease [Planctomycetaceae bacterium]